LTEKCVDTPSSVLELTLLNPGPFSLHWLDS
jgi:hypothetical protein